MRVFPAAARAVAATLFFGVACGGTSVSHVERDGTTTGGTGGTAGTAGTGGMSESPPACCTSDGECSHAACPLDDPGCPRSVCVETECKFNDVGQCWRDDQCPAGEACSGAFVCGCAADCSRPDHPGLCVPAGIGCCLSDQDCSRSFQCLRGVCWNLPVSSCYLDNDCPNSAFCESGPPCPCGAPCVKDAAPAPSGFCLP